MKISWLKAAPLLALNVVFWLAYAVMVGVLWVIGLLLIPLATMLRGILHTRSVVWTDRSMHEWASGFGWMRPVWGNEQDGIDGVPTWPDEQYRRQQWWAERTKTMSWVRRIFEWSALRNSTNNLRFMHYFVPWLGWLNPNTIEPSRIRWAGTEAPLATALGRRFACLFVSQGLYAGLRIAVRFRGRAHQIWFGWKLNPGMAVEGWWPDDPCWKGVGFTCGQVRHSP